MPPKHGAHNENVGFEKYFVEYVPADARLAVRTLHVVEKNQPRSSFEGGVLSYHTGDSVIV